MANNTFTGAAGGAWATGGNWSAGHKPTAGETAIITTNMPAAPLVAETVLKIQFDNIFSGLGIAFTNLTVTSEWSLRGGTTIDDFSLFLASLPPIIRFTGTTRAKVHSDANPFAFAGTLIASNDLIVMPGAGGNVDLIGATVQLVGSFIAFGFDGASIIVDATTTITSTGGVGSVYFGPDVSGSPTTTGFEPLSKIGAAGAVQSTRGLGAIITLPAITTVLPSAGPYGAVGTASELNGTASAGGGGRMSLGLS